MCSSSPRFGVLTLHKSFILKYLFFVKGIAFFLSVIYTFLYHTSYKINTLFFLSFYIRNICIYLRCLDLVQNRTSTLTLRFICKLYQRIEIKLPFALENDHQFHSRDSIVYAMVILSVILMPQASLLFNLQLLMDHSFTNLYQQNHEGLVSESLSDPTIRKQIRNIPKVLSSDQISQKIQHHFLHVKLQTESEKHELKQQSKPRSRSISKTNKNKIKSVQAQKRIGLQGKISNKILPKNAPFAGSDPLFEETNDCQFRAALQKARSEFVHLVDRYEQIKHDICQNIRTKSQDQRSILFDLKQNFKKLEVAFNILDSLEAKLLKFEQNSLKRKEQELNMLRFECSEAFYLTESIYFKKSQKLQRYQDAKRNDLLTSFYLQQDYRLQEQIFIKCGAKYQVLHSRIQIFEECLEKNKQCNKWYERKKLEHQKMMQRDKAISLFEEQILGNERLRQKEFICIEDQLQDAKKHLQQAEKEVKSIKKMIAYFQIADKSRDERRVQNLQRADQNRQYWMQIVIFLEEKYSKMHEYSL